MGAKLQIVTGQREMIDAVHAEMKWREEVEKIDRAGDRVSHREQYSRYVNSPEFLASFEWRRLRMEILKKFGPRCQCCGAAPEHGVRVHVDHIKPRKLFPALALDATNLQVLCEECNHGKGNWDTTDWR